MVCFVVVNLITSRSRKPRSNILIIFHKRSQYGVNEIQQISILLFIQYLLDGMVSSHVLYRHYKTMMGSSVGIFTLSAPTTHAVNNTVLWSKVYSLLTWLKINWLDLFKMQTCTCKHFLKCNILVIADEWIEHRLRNG